MNDLGPWVLAEPKIQHTSSDGRHVKSKPINGLRRQSKHGIQASIDKPNTSWVIHCHTRSELKYAAKLLHPDVNKQAITLKPSRKGYLLLKESLESRQLATKLVGPTHQPPQAYIDSCKTFIDRCSIRDLITATQAEKAKEPITNRINAMDPAQIRSNKAISTHTFRGTHFLQLVKQHSRKSSPQSNA